MNAAGYLFLVLFAITLFVLYIAIRRRWGPALYTGGTGALLSILWVILFALVGEETSTAQAILAGLVVGLGFAAAVIVIAIFFRANQPSPDIELVTRSSQEDSNHEGRDHPYPPPE